MADIELVIKIPEDDYNYIKRQVADGITNPLKVRIANGTPLPENPTNGDMIKALFADNFTINEYLNDTRGLIDEVHLCHGRDLLVQFDKDWWNAPYKRGKTE